MSENSKRFFNYQIEDKKKGFSVSKDHNSKRLSFANEDSFCSVSKYLDQRPMYYREGYYSHRYAITPSSYYTDSGPYSVSHSHAVNSSNLEYKKPQDYPRIDTFKKYYKQDYDARYASQSANLYKNINELSNIPENEVKRLYAPPPTMEEELGFSANVQLKTKTTKNKINSNSSLSNLDWQRQESQSNIKSVYVRDQLVLY